ncbi:MAG: T9SS type A sorting domain-containing protein [Bacteroidales bacterium]|nr:T9SS type A sorting domain-containing protein [Bacteroidales bacterium]
MRYFFLLQLFILSLINSFGQNIKHIAAYDNNSTTTSGLFAIGDTAIYRYSWYYQEWFPLLNNGLVRFNDTVQLNAFAVYNNESSNSSGIFVFSDTAVFNYNWITTTWYPLSNDGLPKVNQKPNVKALAVYGPPGSSSNSTVFVLTDTAVFRYSWSFQNWSPLSNTGLNTFLNDKESFQELRVSAFPNPCSAELNLEILLPASSSGDVEVAVFDFQGRIIGTEKFVVGMNATSIIKPDISKLAAGLYFFEVYDGANIKILKVMHIE